jgi:antitoxin (DNA-binding transcriptional repressor) of toxin-antitoxin stability system
MKTTVRLVGAKITTQPTKGTPAGPHANSLRNTMQVSIVDLRNRMKEVLEALNRNEKITLLYHQKKIASIIALKEERKIAVKEHPLFGMLSSDKSSVAEQMNKLRGGRYHDL